MKKIILLTFSLMFSSMSHAIVVDPDADLLKEANSGVLSAQEEVAKFYEFSGQENDALTWLYTAYENGSGASATKIAESYRDGLLGLRKDLSETHSWYLKAAKLNDKKALIYLSEKYRKSLGKLNREKYKYDNMRPHTSELVKYKKQKKYDEDRALGYLVKCIDALGDPECDIKYAKLRRDVSGDEDLSAFKAVNRAAKDEYPQAFTELAFYFSNGHIVEKDNDQAYKYLKYAASKNDPEALAQIGKGYLYGDIYDLDKDEKQGLLYLNRAGKLGFGKAYRILGDYYYLNRDDISELNKAISYYQKGVNLEDLYAIWNLATLYVEHGKTLRGSVNYYLEDIARLFKLASDAGLVEAHLALAESYEKGMLNLYPRSKAKHYYQLAANQGSKVAELKLKNFN